MYATYNDYTAIYGTSDASQADFTRLTWIASRTLEDATTTADGFCKACRAKPTRERDLYALKHVFCDLIHAFFKIETAEAAAEAASGYITRDDGTVIPKQIASMSSGTESVSYSSNGVSASSATATRYKAAAMNENEKQQIVNDVLDALRGIHDANGVNMLYRGVYPYV